MAPNGKTNAPAQQETLSGTIAKPTPFQIMIRAMAMDATADDGSFSGDDLNAILSAETEDELWESDERPPLNFQHLAGCEIEILDFSMKFSRTNDPKMKTPFVWVDEQDNSRKMYVIAKCVRLSDAGDKKLIRLPGVGEVFEANTSARFVVTKMWRAMTMGLINANNGKGLQCVVQETDLGDGQGVLKLRPIPTRSVRTVTES
jgi:hypothetical protein